MRIRAICCEIITREACRLAAESPLVVDRELLHKGRHVIGDAKMRAHLQDAVDRDHHVFLGLVRVADGEVHLSSNRRVLVACERHQYCRD